MRSDRYTNATGTTISCNTTLPSGLHVIRGRAWSGAGASTNVEVSVDGGATWQTAHIELPRERWMWVRWSFVWEA